jgi:hypothetical protein
MGADYFESNGVWKWPVTSPARPLQGDTQPSHVTDEAGSEEVVSWSAIAASHPLLREYAAKVERAVMDLGLELHVFDDPSTSEQDRSL